MLAGLLHDIGYWVLAQECAADLNTAVELSVTAAIPLHEAETLVMGASHAEVGAYMLGLWGLPIPSSRLWLITISRSAQRNRVSTSWQRSPRPIIWCQPMMQRSSSSLT
jgi:HD-like signal output (HDOD) protein